MAGINRKANRKAGKGRGKLWKKGHSCVSNPEFNKHRVAAKKRSYFGDQGSGSLTVAKLEQHNKLTTENQLDENDDAMSIGNGTALTAFTNCSLPTFSRLLKNWNSNSFLHKEMLAVLEAVADVIKSSGEEESEIKYFSALMVLLDTIETDETVTAVICLLSIIAKKINKSILMKLQEKSVLETFTKLLIKYMNSDHCALLRNLLSIIFAFLKVKSVWPEKCEELNVVLECATHHKPRVRRTAHSIIRNLLVDRVPGTACTHRQASTIADFCIKKLETKSSNSRDAFYILSLLHEIIGCFPKLSIKKTCETVIKVMTLSNSMMTSSCLKALQGVFISKSSDNLTAELNAKIISALYPYQPNLKEMECMMEWLQLMEKALINLCKLDEKLGISHLPHFFSVSVKCWLSDSEDVMQSVATTLNNLLYTCIDPNHVVFQQFLFDNPVNNPMHKMFHHAEGALSYQYHKAWKYVIFVLAGFFEIMGKHCHTVMLKCLQSLADLHDSFKFPFISEVERALGTAVEHMGPRIVLTAIPLQIGDQKPDFPRSWMLPLLRDHIKKTELGFFMKYFLGLAKKMRNKALTLQQEGKVVESKLFGMIYEQIWSLLPGFCTEPTDLEKAFKEEGTGEKGLPRILADVLKHDPALRLTILSSIRLLITKNFENEKHIETMAKFSINYLPCFFNLYAPDDKDLVEEKVRLAIYETIKVYLQITKKDVCESLFATAISKVSSLESNTFKQSALIDITKAMIPYVNEKYIEQLYDYCKPLLQHSNHTVQKKAYGVVKEICSCSSEACKSFVKTYKEDLRSVLSKAISTLPPSTKALRLNSLQNMVSQFTLEEVEFIKEIVPEAVLCTKENSVKARTAAYNLLVEIGHSLKRLMPQNEKGALRDYMTLLLAGLMGSPHLMSATILAIGRVMYEFKAELDSDIIHLLIENMCLLLTSRSREVVVSALSFLKVLFAVVDTMTLAQHVEFLVKSITNISEDNQRHFRFKAKEIFSRLIRKFGFAMISKLVPEKYQKQLTNIRKVEARKQRKKDLRNIDDEEAVFDKTANEFDDILADSDDELNENVPLMKSVKHGKKNKKSYLEDDDEDDIVDFMDPSVNKRLTSMPEKISHPQTKQATNFPVAADGRIIIEDDEDDSKKKKIKKDKLEFEELVKINKRKFEDSDDEEKPETDTQDVKKGIHRTIPPKAKKKCPGAEFKAKKAGGDVKKGKFEPFAYVPFNRQALNKRKQVKLKGQFKNLVKSARKGTALGLKQKAREARRKKK